VDFGKIKNDLCRTYDLDDEKFYSLVEQLMANHPEKYELSSGGEEGLRVSGLIHGFVRCI
jgi:hypothetical protein